MRDASVPVFLRYVGIDYSGAKTANDGLKGLRVYMAEGDGAPAEVPSPGDRKYWSRRGLAEWLRDVLREDLPTLVGIDHAFSFPAAYFDKHHLPQAWTSFLDDFCYHWPTDRAGVTVKAVLDGEVGKGSERRGHSTWRRITDRRAGAAKSPFHFHVPGQVAMSTHAGLPWLRFLRKETGDRIHFWPFDGWGLRYGKSLVAEVYPALWSSGFPHDNRTLDQHDAYVATAWLQRAGNSGSLEPHLTPELPHETQLVAQFEGWILGVG